MPESRVPLNCLSKGKETGLYHEEIPKQDSTILRNVFLTGKKRSPTMGLGRNFRTFIPSRRVYPKGGWVLTAFPAEGVVQWEASVWAHWLNERSDG